MLSKLQKISKDLILYSVLVSDFEKLDFKNDALAGVRANYFNSKCSPQTEKTEINIDNRMHMLSYSMKRQEPLSWKVMIEKRTVQTVKRGADGGYCVMSYGENGIIFKRQYFDSNHIWLRSEYYNRELENQISAVIYPRGGNGLIVLRLQRFTQKGIDTIDLYPTLTAPKKRCDALIYSNSGMIWYDAQFKPTESDKENQLQNEIGFSFTREAFLSANSSDLLDLKNAAYLSENDIEKAEEKADLEPVIPETQTYSAYDKIENILFEAHKTNKNIFGELANHTLEDEALTESEQTEADSTFNPETPAEVSEKESSDEDETAAMTDVTSENAAAHDFTEKLNDAVDEDQPDSSEQETELEVLPEPEPEAFINTKNGTYSYFGDTDENNQRSGKGRTVTPEGLTAYEGDYFDDKRHGFGVCYYKEGSPNYIGDWDMGNRSGRGVGYRLSDGTMHAGKWNDNKPDGFGARFDRDGNFLDVCTYINGKRNGKSVSFDEDGNLVVRMWKDGEQIAEKIISD